MIQQILPDLNTTLCDTLQQMFGQSSWRNIKRKNLNTLPDFQDYMVCIQVQGENEEGELILTFTSSTAETLLHMIDIKNADVSRTKLLHSVLGELANVVTCQLMTCPSFLEHFGSVSISPPFVWDAHCPQEGCIPLRKGCQGSVCKGGKSIKTFIAASKAHAHEVNVYKDETMENN